MKYIRKFNSTQERDAALANVSFDVLAGVVSGDTITIEIHEGTPVVDYSIPFYVENITNEEETLTIAGCDWSEQGDYLEIPVEISTDGTAWTTFGTTGATPLTRTLNPGDKVYLRATTNTWYIEDVTNEASCSIFGVSKVGGNIMSLLYGGNFTNLFSYITDDYNENIVLRDASELILPATTLTNECYAWMFYNCISLTTTPTLPATTLDDGCYIGMFECCESLTAAPELPATSLGVDCYSGMFRDCTSLTTAPALPATTLATSCYQQMFRNCSSLTTAPELPATTLAENCYESMFSGCSSLTTAPVLSATTLVDGCYFSMFAYCTSLNSVTTYTNSISATNCLTNWLDNVAATGNFYNLGSATYPSGPSGIPTGWTEHTSL